MKTLGSSFRIAALAAACLLMASGSAFADGTETLGAPGIDIAEGSGIAIGGTGLFSGVACPWTNEDGVIAVDVPIGASVNQVLLYWVGVDADVATGDDEITVDGKLVTGTSIGGATLFVQDFFCAGTSTDLDLYWQAYRADITGLGLVGPGMNTINITDADAFTLRSEGAGIMVIYDDGTSSTIEIRDGLDMAFFQFTNPLDATAPQTFTFDAAAVDRNAQIPIFVSSVGDSRPNVTEITTGGFTTPYFNLFTSADGPEWDSVMVPVTIPAGETSLTIELISADGNASGGTPASLAWVAAGLVIEEPEEEECGECDGKVTRLVLEYNGPATTRITVIQKVQGRIHTAVIFDEDVDPGEQFEIIGVDNKDTLGAEIILLENLGTVTKIHTSCSQAIGPGLVAGNFEVIEGESRHGGLLCPVETPPPGNEDCECDGKVTELTLSYNGVAPALIRVEQKSGNSHNVVVFNSVVAVGEEFDVFGVDKQGTLGPEISIFVNGQLAAKIHTSCSQPIGPGLVVGNFEVTRGFSRNNGLLCPLELETVDRGSVNTSSGTSTKSVQTTQTSPTGPRASRTSRR